MKENFIASLKHLLKSEGGFTNDPRDPGNKLPDGRAGSTMLGVTQATWENFIGKRVTQEQMKQLRPESVGPIYKVKYWDAVKGDELPAGLDYLMFDFAVNAGPGRAAKIMQEALGVTADGVIGRITMKAISEADPHDLIERFSDAKEAYYRSLKTFETFGKGWLRRVSEVKGYASEMLA
jgi:lysozyme family protein